MKYLALAFVVVGLMACDFGSTFTGQSKTNQHNWAVADSIGIGGGGGALVIEVLKGENGR